MGKIELGCDRSKMMEKKHKHQDRSNKGGEVEQLMQRNNSQNKIRYLRVDIINSHAN